MALSEDLRARTVARFERHRQAWDRNPALRALYAEWYARVAAELPPPELGPRIELGSGPGFARQFIPDLQLSDIVGCSWHDHELSAEALPFPDATVGVLVMVDVLHHLPAPARFFAEAMRTLRPGGRIVLCEPYLSPGSYPIYKLLHEEPITMNVDPLADQTGADARDPFESNQAIPTLLFGRERSPFAAAFPALAVLRVARLAGLSYPASGGFSRRPLLPLPLFVRLQRLESRLPEALLRWYAFRMLVTIERRT